MFANLEPLNPLTILALVSDYMTIHHDLHSKDNPFTFLNTSNLENNNNTSDDSIFKIKIPVNKI